MTLNNTASMMTVLSMVVTCQFITCWTFHDTFIQRCHLIETNDENRVRDYIKQINMK